MPIALPAEMVFWALYVVLPSGVGTVEVEVAASTEPMGPGIVFVLL